MNNQIIGLRSVRKTVGLCLALTFSTAMVASAKYSGGSGTEDDPYQIGSIEDWEELAGSSEDWDKHFVLTADIDFGGAEVQQVAPDTSSDSFTGVFDGAGHVLRNGSINKPNTDYVGVFGKLGSDGEIRNLGVEGIDVTGEDFVGGLVGRNEGTITSCYATGAVSGVTGVGGLVGRNEGTITSCYATGEVSGNGWVGGLVGRNEGTITWNGWVGGLVGENYDGTITSCYATGIVSGNGNVGGLVGSNWDGSVTASFWDIEISGFDGSASGKGLTTEQMKTVSNFQNAGWGDYNWVMNEGQYPRLDWEGTGASAIPEAEQVPLAGNGNENNPYQVGTVEEFRILNSYIEVLDKHIQLTADLDFDGAEIEPIGVLGPFTGEFDGNGHVISKGQINKTNSSQIGVFRQVGEGGEIKNLGVEEIDVSGDLVVGGLVGRNEGTITSCYATGAVSGKDNYVGGLVGKNDGTITSCYATGEVLGRGRFVGGLVGENKGTITSCYATGAVTGDSYDVGGLVGENISGTITSCYATGAVSGDDDVGGLVGENISGTITSCYATGDVSGDNRIGGLVGDNWGTITSCYAAGAVSGGQSVGGLVGENISGTITSCYATGAVSGDDYVGGLVGENISGTITSCYWDVDTSGITESDGGEGRTTDQMTYPYSSDTYVDWDFESTWIADEDGRNGGYPYLWDVAGVPSSVSVDLAVEDVQFSPTTLVVGDGVDVSFRVKNLSGVASVPSKAGLRLSQDVVLSDSDPGLVPLEVEVPGVGSGGSIMYSDTFEVPGSLRPGDYHIAVVVDPAGELDDGRRDNNVELSSTRLEVAGTGQPSLSVSPEARTIDAGTGYCAFFISNVGGDVLSWSAEIDETPWLGFVNESEGEITTQEDTLLISCEENLSQVPRTGRVIISASDSYPALQMVTITQEGAPPPPPEVTHIEFDQIPSPQKVNEGFPVRIRAMNANVEPPIVQTSFNGRVGLESENGGNLNFRYIELVNGEWSGRITLDTSMLETRLEAQASIGERGVLGKSNPFAVESAQYFCNELSIKVLDSMDQPIQGASVYVLHEEVLLVEKTDSSGKTGFDIADNALYTIKVMKDGWEKVERVVHFRGTPIFEKIKLQHAGPAVVFVPGILGSRGEGLTGLMGRIPILPKEYPAPAEMLEIHETPGWSELEELLRQSGYQVFRAPYDWRMPPLTGDEGQVTWKKYLRPVIDKAKRVTGDDKVDVVAHSMGGLLTRAYIQSAEYEWDIEKFACVGTPHLGAATAYKMWYGGEAKLSYDLVLSYNYAEFTGQSMAKGWIDNNTSIEKMDFYHDHVKSLKQLLPVYENSVLGSFSPTAAIPTITDGIFVHISGDAYPGMDQLELYKLNLSGLERYDCRTEDTVCTKSFGSDDHSTIWQIVLNANHPGSNGIYPYGIPRSIRKRGGDGTVFRGSALYEFPGDFSGKEKHSRLIGDMAEAIVDFINEGREVRQVQQARAMEAEAPPPESSLMVSTRGRCRVWLVDPLGKGIGVEPESGSITNGWQGAELDIGAYGSMFDMPNPEFGVYQGTMRGFAGELVTVEAAFSGTNGGIITDLTWIGKTNDIKFNFELDADDGGGLVMRGEEPPPVGLRSFESNGVCMLTWSRPEAEGDLSYRIYSRQENENLFRLLGSTTNLTYNTGHSWTHRGEPDNRLYTVVTVGADGSESPFTDIVRNSSQVVAKFSADITNGTPPLTVNFTNQSLGDLTSCTWDFNGDGGVDSTELNPTTVFAMPGSYTVTLNVDGPAGEDTRINVGYITVNMPELHVVDILPDGTVELSLNAQAGREYEIQAGPDLNTWTAITNFTATNATTIFVDPAASGHDQRFYRAVVP